MLASKLRYVTFRFGKCCALAVATGWLAGCSAFNYEWRQAARLPAPTNDITGRWQGHWTSEATGHHDALRCLVIKVDDNNYDAKFHAAYKRWITFRFGYTVRLEAAPSNNVIRFHGAENLGRLAGGLYTYDGFANPTNFFSRYKSKYDHGTFQMSRP